MQFAIWIAGAFVAGLVARQLGLPPLVGFLAAGFGLRALGYEADAFIGHLSEIGVLLLLFTVGLKIRLLSLIRPEVVGAGLGHLALVGGGLSLLILGISSISTTPAIVLGLALGFSSTVVAAKMLESRREQRSFHGRVSIGILVIQDLVAVAILATVGGHAPTPWAFALLGLIALRPLFARALEWIGHGELLVVYGGVLALAVGGFGFEQFGLSPELGALVMGTLIADHPKAKELGDALWGLKEFLLVGFFVYIGLSALPTWEILGLSLLLTLLLPVKAVLFLLLLLLFGLRARTAFLASLALASYSEFGLIVTQFGVEEGLLDSEWLIAAALTVSISFAIVAPLNRNAHSLYERYGRVFERFESRRRHPDDQPVSLGSAEVIVVGMGRIGAGAYDHLQRQGFPVAGLENDPGKLQANRAAGRRVVFADAEDPGFWHRLNLDRVRAVLLALPDLEGITLASQQLRLRGFQGLISATHRYADDRARILAAGADVAFNSYAEAGLGFATHTCESLKPPQVRRQQDVA